MEDRKLEEEIDDEELTYCQVRILTAVNLHY